VGSVLKFFFLTYAVSWTSWIAVVAISRPTTPATPAVAALRSVLLLVGTFAPALVALLLTKKTDGGAGGRALLRRLFQWRVPARWYLFAIAYMPAIKLAAAVTHRFIIGTWPRFGHEGPLIIAIAILISAPAQSGEEIGWRGYALPRLAAQFGLARASLLVGVGWGIWHLPFFFLPGADKFGQSFVVFVMGTIALSVAIAWLYGNTHGSLLLTMLMHSAFNQTIGIVSDMLGPGERAFALGASLAFLLTVVWMWIAAGYFLAWMPKAELAGGETLPARQAIST
jgi:membrane protease YdiL (CAAX protease family)